MTDRFYRFAEIEKFMCYYTPKSPYGRNAKLEKKHYTEAEPLNGIFDHIDQMVKLIINSPVKADKIEYHLSRLPELSLQINDGNIRSEIFNIKTFLINYKFISKEIPLDFHSDDLLKKLGFEGNSGESFYLVDEYSPELTEVRKKLRHINKQLDELKEKKILDIYRDYDLDFRFHSFLIIKEDLLAHNGDSSIYIEPYDKSSVMVKPILGKEYFQIHNSRKELLLRETRLEWDILEFLKRGIIEERDKIQSYINKVVDLDTTLAKARLAIRFQCSRPKLTESENIHIEKLQYIPLKEKCVEANRKYTCLSASFDARNIVVTGSNMGGKSILLKSIAFSQLLVQRGFFVPARKIETSLFDSMNFIGNIDDDYHSGLSSFGEEILNLIETGREGKLLYLVDEFARTTNSREAFALNCSLLQWFSEQEDLFSFTATHMDKLPDFQNLSYWTMRGLDYDKYSLYYHRDYNCDLNERINLINDFMDFSVKPLENAEIQKDALKIADILGLDREIIENAKKYILKEENNYGE